MRHKLEKASERLGMQLLQKQGPSNGPHSGDNKHQQIMSVLDKISHPSASNELPSTLEVPTSQIMGKL